LRIGLLGTASSGKSSLVHRYLTGQYVQDESPEGGRFKKEVNVDGQGFLLLIRDEAEPPSLQFSGWVDAVMFVFNLESEASLSTIPEHFAKLRHHRNPFEVPLIVVGTLDGVSDSSPRVIETSAAEKFAMSLHPNCCYFEASAINGTNIDTVFAEACKRILRLRQHPAHFLPNAVNNKMTPTVTVRGKENTATTPAFTRRVSSPTSDSITPRTSNNPLTNSSLFVPAVGPNNPTGFRVSNAITASLQAKSPGQTSPEGVNNNNSAGFVFKAPTVTSSSSSAKAASSSFRRKIKSDLSSLTVQPSTKDKDVTPTSTPSVARKHKRRSHIFPNLTGSKNKAEENHKNGCGGDALGSGRAIPLRQGYLYKKSVKTLNKDWKKKYVTLTSDGTLTYHPTLHDYMNNTHGKEIPLKHTTVKVPGSKFKLKGITPTTPSLTASGIVFNQTISQEAVNDPQSKPLKKEKEKKHRRTKSNVGKHSEDDSDGAEFMVVSLENKEWRFDAETSSERQGWVTAIEQQILSSLQELESDKSKTTNLVDKTTIQGIKNVSGNDKCADCGHPDPVWSSLNLGTLICIECSGIHRNLGTHISKVRSLDLDDWSPAQTALMKAMGNSLVNEMFESTMKSGVKPCPSSSHENKESFIRSKYENKEYLLPLRVNKQLDQQMMDAIGRNDVQTIALILAHKPLSQVFNLSRKHFPLHVAASAGNLAITQLLILVCFLGKKMILTLINCLFITEQGRDQCKGFGREDCSLPGLPI